jgi:CRP/FNR family transcriptional regulator, dissimilatory nitrate respiration regulator
LYKEWESILLKFPLFQNIHSEELQVMLECLKPVIRTYRKGDTVVLAGEPYHGVGMILSGCVSVMKDTAAGSRILMGLVEKGQIFGEVAAFSETGEWPASVYAHENSVIMFLPPHIIIGECPRMCRSHRTLILNMLRVISSRALILNRQVEYMAIKTIRGKLAAYLLELARKTGSHTFLLPVKRHELAQFFNVSRPSLSREMKAMKEEGIIDYHMSSVRIQNMPVLAKLVEQG